MKVTFCFNFDGPKTKNLIWFCCELQTKVVEKFGLRFEVETKIGEEFGFLFELGTKVVKKFRVCFEEKANVKRDLF